MGVPDVAFWAHVEGEIVGISVLCCDLTYLKEFANSLPASLSQKWNHNCILLSVQCTPPLAVLILRQSVNSS